MEFNDMTPRHGEVEYWMDRYIDMKQENARLREALGEIVNGAIYPHEIAREALINV